MLNHLKKASRLGLTLQVVKISISAGLSWWLATFLPDSSYPVFAPLAAVLVTQVTVVDSLYRSLYRILGVILGVGVGGFVGHFLGINAWSIFLAIGIGLSVSTAFRLNPQIISQVGVSSLLVLDYGHNHGYMIERVAETTIGAFVAVIVTLLFSPPETFAAVKQKILSVTEEMAALLRKMGVYPADGDWRQSLLTVRERLRQTENHCADMLAATRNLRFKPFSYKERLAFAKLGSVMNRLERMAVQLRSMARTLTDLYVAGKHPDDMAEVFAATATCIVLLGESVCVPSPENKQRLKQAIIEAHQCQQIAFLHIQQTSSFALAPECGGLFTDLGRILAEVENRASCTARKDSRRLLPKPHIYMDE